MSEETKQEETQKKKENLEIMLIAGNGATWLILLITALISPFKSAWTGYLILGIFTIVSFLGWGLKFYLQDKKPKEEPEKTVEMFLSLKRCSKLIDYYLQYEMGIRIGDTISEGIRNVGQENKEKTKVYLKIVKDKDTRKYIYFAIRPDNLEYATEYSKSEIEEEKIREWLNDLANNPRYKAQRTIVKSDELTGRETRIVEDIPIQESVFKEKEEGEKIE